MVALIQSKKHKNQLAGLSVIAGLALSSEAAARKLLTPDLLSSLMVSCRKQQDFVALVLSSQPRQVRHYLP